MPPLSPTDRGFARDSVRVGSSSSGSIGGGGSIGGVSSSGGGDGSGRRGGVEKGPSEGKDGAGLEGRMLRQRHPPLSAADFNLLTFARGEGTGEWDYPWDLTGGLYR